MRHCPKCDRDKDDDQFTRKGNGYQPYCGECNKLAKQIWYQQNKVSVIAKSRERKKRDAEIKREWIRSYLEKHTCSDCPETDLVVLEFDHLRDKEKSVSRLIQDGSLAKLKAEVEKCEVVCANCHRRRTSQRSGSWRLGAVV